MSLWQLMGYIYIYREREREREDLIIYIHICLCVFLSAMPAQAGARRQAIIFENPLFDTSGILILEREIERERDKINYN